MMNIAHDNNLQTRFKDDFILTIPVTQLFFFINYQKCKSRKFFCPKIWPVYVAYLSLSL